MSVRWEIDDVRTGRDRRPVKDFLDGLSKETKAKIYAALEMLAQEGNQLRMPKSRSLGEGLHELRVPHPEGPVRIIYCFLPGRRIMLLHAFVKRTEQTPRRDLDLAKERRPE